MSMKKLVIFTTSLKPAPTDSSASFMFSKHCVHWARKSPGAPANLPSAVMPSCPAT